MGLALYQLRKVPNAKHALQSFNGDERDLKNCPIVKAGCSQLFVILLPDLGGIFGELNDVVEHDTLLGRDRSGGVVTFQRFDQSFVQRNATQKLCVGIDSIHAPVGDRDHGGDHFVMAALERQIGGHERTEGGKSMVQRLGNQGVRGYDFGAAALGRMDRGAVFHGIEQLLSFHGLAKFTFL